MSDQSGIPPAGRRLTSRKFFCMTASLSKRPAGLVLVNEAEVKHAAQRRFDIRDPRDRGFSRFPRTATPHFRHLKAAGRKPADLEQFAAYWIVTERVSTVFDTIDPEAFEYMNCEVFFDDGTPTVQAWLCDVVRLLDALDETASDVAVRDVPPKRYNFAGARRVVYRDDAVGPAHVFRNTYGPGEVFCDNIVREACRAAGLRCITFIDAVAKPVVIPDCLAKR